VCAGRASARTRAPILQRDSGAFATTRVVVEHCAVSRAGGMPRGLRSSLKGSVVGEGALTGSGCQANMPEERELLAAGSASILALDLRAGPGDLPEGKDRCAVAAWQVRVTLRWWSTQK
jgi:hypothetical protein